MGNGSAVNIVGFGNIGEFIPPSPDYLCLFKIRMDICCIPDADTLRETLISLWPGGSSLSDTLGYDIPLRDHMGGLLVWWSVPGDANGDSSVNAVDVVFLINYLFIGGPEPCVCEAVDCNNDGVINAVDVVYLINYLFIHGPAPLRGSVSCWHEDCWP
ncbi:MAG: dockerin type I repeat-containing protein [candidate division Zixibacteria bacterium]|nr:dockerin type I repeat-containing protein [candidate division Zixibacteria bacterium]